MTQTISIQLCFSCGLYILIREDRSTLANPLINFVFLEFQKTSNFMGRNPLGRDPLVHGVFLDAEIFGNLVNGKVSVFHAHNLLKGQLVRVDPSWSSLESDRRPDAKGQCLERVSVENRVFENGNCGSESMPGRVGNPKISRNQLNPFLILESTKPAPEEMHLAEPGLHRPEQLQCLMVRKDEVFNVRAKSAVINVFDIRPEEESNVEEDDDQVIEALKGVRPDGYASVAIRLVAALDLNPERLCREGRIRVGAEQIIPLIVGRGPVGQDIAPEQLSGDKIFRAEGDHWQTELLFPSEFHG